MYPNQGKPYLNQTETEELAKAIVEKKAMAYIEKLLILAYELGKLAGKDAQVYNENEGLR